MMKKRVLSIQSHVVSGYVGNKSACFPLQLLGFDVDAINSVQYSNHTGFPHWRGQVLNSEELSEIVDGLKLNNLLNYSHILTGYVGTKSFLQELVKVLRDVKKLNPSIIYACDPVMGDGDQMYVPADLLPIYKEEVIVHADILTPNQYETELLTSIKIKQEEDAFRAIDILHGLGIPTVVISSTNLGTKDVLVGFASTVKGPKTRLRLEMSKFPASFTGTGDLFTSLLIAWMFNTNNDLKESCEKAISTMQSVLKRTLDYATYSSGKIDNFGQDHLELRLIQSQSDILNPSTECGVRVVKL